jgi:hypothetical protein
VKPLPLLLITIHPSQYTMNTASQETPKKSITYAEVVGLFEANNGRTCVTHSICGAQVKVGFKLILKPCVIINGKYHQYIRLIL